jgi:PAS domain S-box-containing protein
MFMIPAAQPRPPNSPRAGDRQEPTMSQREIQNTEASPVSKLQEEAERNSERLQQSERLLKIAGRAARIGGWLVDVPTRRLIWSDEVCAIHGVPAGTSPSFEEALSCYAPEWRDRISQVFTACVTDEKPFDEELEIINVSGERIWVRAIGEPSLDNSGNCQVQGALQDISERVNAKQSLLESRKRFRDLADAMPHIVWTATADGLVDYSNQEFYQYSGLTHLDLIDGQWTGALHPEDIDLCFGRWLEAIKSGAAFSLELRIRRATDNSYRWHMTRAQPVRDNEGEIVKWYGTTTDIHDRKEAEEKARSLAQRLTTTLESITDAFFTLDRDWRFTYLNKQAERVLQRPRATLLGRTLWTEYQDALGTTFDHQYRRAMAQGCTAEFEEYYPPLDKWLKVSAYPSEEGLAVYLRDITDQHLADRKIRESEQRFRAVARVTTDVVWDWTPATNSMWWNEGLERVFGYKPEEATSTLEFWLQNIHPLDQQRVEQAFAAAIDRKDAVWADQYRFLRSDGTSAQVEDRGHLSFDTSGNLIRLIGGMTDVSDRKMAEERLTQQAALLDSAQDAIVVRTMDNKILFWNRAAERIYGWRAEEVIGSSVEGLLYRDPEQLRAATASVLAEGEWTGQLLQWCKDGTAITVEGHWSLMRDSMGQPQSIMAINTDITRRLALEAQLRQANKLESIGRLTGGVAHDFNNLLTIILGNAELLTELLVVHPKLLMLAELTRSAARRGADLTQRLLAFARQQPLAPQVVEVLPLLKGMDGLLQSAIRQDISVEILACEGLWNALADPSQLEAAILNLAINARDAMPSGGKITLKSSNVLLSEPDPGTLADLLPGQYVLISATDTGTGIAPEHLAKVFDPFFTTKAAGKGTGLGLSSVYGFARQSGGHVRAVSELGRGTTVELYLPRGVAAKTEVTGNPWLDGAPRGSETILVVEDDDMVRQYVCNQIGGLGYHYIETEAADRALDLIGGHTKIDLLFTDVIMPGDMNGKQLAQAARALRPGLKVLYTSGYSDGVFSQDDRMDQTVHLLNKPYQRLELARKIRQVLSSRQGRQP